MFPSHHLSVGGGMGGWRCVGVEGCLRLVQLCQMWSLVPLLPSLINPNESAAPDTECHWAEGL